MWFIWQEFSIMDGEVVLKEKRCFFKQRFSIPLQHKTHCNLRTEDVRF
jgi:hypothetical protein